MSDGPEVSVCRCRSASGEAIVLVEIGVEGRQPGALALVIDLSDSSPVAASDLGRLPRLLGSLPRRWAVAITGLGQALSEAASRYEALTVGDLVDGVVDFVGLCLDTTVLSRERAAGSFAASAIRRCLNRFDLAFGHRVVVVVTDAKWADIDPVRLPSEVRVLGVAPEQGTVDQSRWAEIIEGAPFLGRDSGGDTVGRVRAVVGCGFAGPCTITIPRGRYGIRGGDGTKSIAPVTERSRLTWDFSLQGRLSLEFAGAVFPDFLLIEGSGGLEVRLPLPVPEASVEPEVKAVTGGNGSTSQDVMRIALSREELVECANKVRELAEARQGWRSADGHLAVCGPHSALSRWLVDEHCQSRSDAFVLIVPEHAQRDEAPEVFLVAVSRESKLHFDGDSGETIPVFANGSWCLYFNKLENRWMYSLAGCPPVALAPRGSHSIPVVMSDRERRVCGVFFSGTLR